MAAPHEQQSSDSHPEPPRCPDRRILLWLLLLTILVLGVPAVLIWWRSVDESELDAAIANLDAADPGWRWEELFAARPKIAPDQNGAVKAIEAAQWTNGSAGADPALDCLTEVPLGARQLNGPQEAALLTYIGKQAKALALARELHRFPRACLSRESVLAISLYCPTEPRAMISLLEFDVHYQLHIKDYRQASLDCLGMLYCARSYAEGPLIHHLVQVAGIQRTIIAMERTLACGQLEEADLERWQKALAEDAREDVLAKCLRWERAYSHHLMQLMRNRDRTELERILGSAALKGGIPAYSARDAALHLIYATAQIEAASLPPQHWQERMKRVYEEARLHFRKTADAPLLHTSGSPWQRSLAQMRSVIVATAAERYRLRHGSLPERLDNLVAAKLLDSVPTDPYNGKPLRSKREEQGLCIYSVGENRLDDGGLLMNDIGIAEDIGVWLLRPSERRAPPLPPGER